VVGILQAEDELVLEPANLAVEMQVRLVDEVVDLLPALMGAEAVSYTGAPARGSFPANALARAPVTT